MQTTSYSVRPTADVVQSLELQNRPPGVPTERIDPILLQFLRFLFPCQFEGVKFLALLCRRATEKQLAMFKEPVAVITFHGIATLCKAPNWEWGYHTTLRYFILFEALGVFYRFRRNRMTEVHIPLGAREEPLSQEHLLQSLDDLHKKHAYKDKKLMQLIGRVRNHIEIYGIGVLGDSENGQIDQPSPAIVLSLQERLISVMRAEHIPLAKCQRIATWMCTTQLPQLIRDSMHTTQLLATGRFPEQEGDSQVFPQKLVGRDQCTLGDSERDTLQTNIHQRGDSHNKNLSLQPSDHQANVTQNLPEKQQHTLLSDLTKPDEQPKSPIIASDVVVHSIQGDSEPLLSSKRSILNTSISNGNKTDIENASHAPSEITRSNESLRAEATWIAVELDGEESLKKNGGRGWVGAYKIKLQEHPYLVRVSLIDMYLQRFFPDWRGQPHGRGGQWFNRRYKAYVTGQEAVPAEIESWARSPYSYEHIKKALYLERCRQEQEIVELQQRNPFAVQELRRPFVDCVQLYDLLDDSDCQLQTAHEEKRAYDVTPRNGHQVEELVAVDQSLEEVEQQVTIPEEHREMEDGSSLSLEAHQQLQDRALLALLDDQSPEADDVIQDYIETMQYRYPGKEEIAARLSQVPQNVLRNVRRLQCILPPDLYTIEVLVTPRRRFAIEVRAQDDPTNACVLYSARQTREFIQRFTQG